MATPVTLDSERDLFLAQYWAKVRDYETGKKTAYASKNMDNPVPVIVNRIPADAISADGWRSKLSKKYQDLIKYKATMGAIAKSKLMASQAEAHSRARILRELNKQNYYERALAEVVDDLAFIDKLEVFLKAEDLSITGANYP